MVAFARAGACALALIAAGGAAAQDAQRPKSDPGVFGAIGRWVDETVAGVTSGFGNARGSLDEIGGRAGDTAKGAADAAKDAAAAVARIPATSIVSGRRHCIKAANGAPDCQAATDALCRHKGFSTGRSLDIQSAQKCPTEVWISGQQSERTCTLETYVTRAVCQ